MMKKLTKIIPIFCIFITTILSIVFLDINESKEYLQLSGYQKDYISIKYNENTKITNDAIKNILLLAKKNNVILGKSNISSNENSARNIYLSFDTKKELLKFMSKIFNLKLTNNISDDTNAFISTYIQDNNNLVAIIPDFLNNNLYNYYTFNNLFENNGNLYGEYIVYYNNYNDYSNFYNDVKQFLQQDIYSFARFNNSHQVLLIILIASIFIIMLFYFVFQTYEVYYSSKDIACMRLLGLDKYKISHIMMKKRIKIYLYIILFLLIFSLLFLKNINLYSLSFDIFI